MKKYINPEMTISKFNAENIVTVSGEVTPPLDSLAAAKDYLAKASVTVIF